MIYGLRIGSCLLACHFDAVGIILLFVPGHIYSIDEVFRRSNALGQIGLQYAKWFLYRWEMARPFVLVVWKNRWWFSQRLAMTNVFWCFVVNAIVMDLQDSRFLLAEPHPYWRTLLCQSSVIWNLVIIKLDSAILCNTSSCLGAEEYYSL
jgi:hypothetical protein